MNAAEIALLQEELLRVVARGGVYGTFTAIDGSRFTGATETDVINHLTSKTRFPGIGSGWNFGPAIEAAGFIIRRGQNFRVVTL